MLDRNSISAFAENWIAAWNRHDLDAVLVAMADDVVFEHWNGRITQGKEPLRRVWQPWFEKRDFHFAMKELHFDETRQSFNFEWTLRWPSPESKFLRRDETREGVDLVQLREGKIISKRSFIKTVLKIEGSPVWLKAT